MTLTFVLRLLGRSSGDGATAPVAGRVEVVRSGQEHSIRSMADLERVLLDEISQPTTDRPTTDRLTTGQPTTGQPTTNQPSA